MRPIMVEFTGTPEAGKTTVINKLKPILEAQGLKVIVVQEGAELLPSVIPKGSWDANVWMLHITCAKIIQTKYMECDVVLIDRGAIDFQFFGFKFFKKQECSIEDYIAYMGLFTPNLNPDFLITLTVNPETSLSRRGGPGRLVNMKFLKEYNNLLYPFYKTITIPKTLIDTSSMSIDDVTSQALEVISTQIKAR